MMMMITACLSFAMNTRVQIGEAILKKLPNVKTVVVKTGKITDRFRVFPMEVIAGKKDLETEVKEHGCRFRLDYGKVYWNSRLQTEHARIVRMLHRDDIVCDMFCGIGPFAVPAGMKGVKVYANDLNPESFKWLKENVRLNKVSHRVECFNLDGREFVKDITKRIMATEQQLYNVVTMNLPAIAIEFLDVFKDLYPPTFTKDQMPRIHCYCFARGETPEELRKDALDRVEDVLGHKIVQVDVHNVRSGYIAVMSQRNIYETLHLNAGSFQLLQIPFDKQKCRIGRARACVAFTHGVIRQAKPSPR